MTEYLLDAEWNGDTADRVWVVSVAEYPKGEVKRFTDFNEFLDFVNVSHIDKWYIHSGMTADVPVINSVAGYEVLDPTKVLDTFVFSRLVDYRQFRTHSLKEIGEFLGVYKGDYTGGWDIYTEEMGDYCDQDVEVLRAIVDYYWNELKDPCWADAIVTEHDTAYLCGVLNENGFEFNKELAEDLLCEVTNEMEELEKGFQLAFPPELVLDKTLKLRYTKDGSLYKNITDAIITYPKVEIEDDKVLVYDYKYFNPSSPIDRIDKLWEAGWKPIDKTKGHIAKLKERRKR